MSEQNSVSIPEEFLEQVKQALSHLYDFPYLQHFPLAEEFHVQSTTGSVGLNFRRTLIECIEALNPGKDLLYRSSDGDTYNLLRYYYIDRMTLQEAQIELGISERQSYRVLKRGQISVAELLWTKFNRPVISEPATTSIQAELARLDQNIRTFELGTLIDTAVQAISRLATSYKKRISIQKPQLPVMVTSNYPIAQQVLINLLSFSIKMMPVDVITVRLEQVRHGVRLNVSGEAYLQELEEQTAATEIPRLIEELNWKLSYESQPGHSTVSVTITTDDVKILVIDDNEELSELITRFLAKQPYQVIISTTGQHGLQLAQEISPDIVILDIMMPDMNGWDILQRLRTVPSTETTPVIICSVINDEELAYSLNASYVIVKPISQESLLTALQKTLG